MSLDQNKKILESMRRQTEERLKWPPEKLHEWLSQIQGPQTRELEGSEYEQIYLILLLREPYRSSNNQRTITHYYEHAGHDYIVTYGLCDIPLIEEILR